MVQEIVLTLIVMLNLSPCQAYSCDACFKTKASMGLYMVDRLYQDTNHL